MMKTTTIVGVALVTVSFGFGCSKSAGSIGSGGGDTTSATSATSGASGGGSSASGLSSAAGNLTTSDTTSTGSGQTCDGTDLEGCSCSQNNATRACYSGNPSQAGVGACTMGTQTCTSMSMGEFTSGTWGPCQGSGSPMPEVCGDGIDNDCNGQVDDGCMACVPGTTQACQGNGTETCDATGQWGPCVPPTTCTEGSTQDCQDSNGDAGTQTCLNGMWTPCSVPSTTQMVGGPCTPGTGAPSDPNDPNCSYQNAGGTILYCDDSGMWQCFNNSGCTQDACTMCLQQECSQFLNSSSDPTCNMNIATAWTYLSECGPDRSAYFANLSNGCPNNEVWNLNSCKGQMCTGNYGTNGPCSWW